jgi:hypothetical protein
MHTKDILAAALRDAGLPEMAGRAADGYYHDYLSPLATPEKQLLSELTIIGTEVFQARDEVGFVARMEENLPFDRAVGRNLGPSVFSGVVAFPGELNGVAITRSVAGAGDATKPGHDELQRLP